MVESGGGCPADNSEDLLSLCEAVGRLQIDAATGPQPRYATLAIASTCQTPSSVVVPAAAGQGGRADGRTSTRRWSSTSGSAPTCRAGRDCQVTRPIWLRPRWSVAAGAGGACGFEPSCSPPCPAAQGGEHDG